MRISKYLSVADQGLDIMRLNSTVLVCESKLVIDHV